MIRGGAAKVTYVGRFAPSPTGKMHLGVARTSLAAWLDARKNNGCILLRIEDIDTPRIVPGAAEGLMRDLEWLGLDWDGTPVFQSDRDALYEAAIETLRARDRIYLCTCSRKEIALAASAPHGPSDEGPRYPGTCRDRGPLPGRPAALRLKTEPADVVAHQDLLFGACDQDVHRVAGDFVVRRADRVWAYQLAVSADDLDQGVTRIVRGADLLTSTARQILIRSLLDPNASRIETLHVPLILGPDGKRLAKREGAAGIASRREAGEAPERVVGLLAASLGLVPKGTQIRARELIAHWDPRRLPRDAAVFDSANEMT